MNSKPMHLCRARASLRSSSGAVVCAFVVTVLFLAAAFTVPAAEKAPVLTEKAQQAPDYLIGPGDVLEIIVWREPELSRTVRVRPDGKISLPLVDDVHASHRTLEQLKEKITESLAAYVDSPSVYVMLEENRSKRIYIVGRVTSPGEYVLEKNLTVLQAISMAGGFTEWAKKNDIVILRAGPQGQHRIAFDFDRVVSGKDIAQNILLIPDDVIVVP